MSQGLSLRHVRIGQYGAEDALARACCEVHYTGRLTARLTEAVRLLMFKADGSFLVHDDAGGFRPLNWIRSVFRTRYGLGASRRWFLTSSPTTFSGVIGKTYSKVPFEWTSTVAPGDDPLPRDWSWLTGRWASEPMRLVADVLASSPGPEDCYAVDVLGAEEAARRTLALAPGFSYLPERWHVLSVRDETAGFVLPVIYDGCSRDGLDEATIYHMGVAPQHRGTGIGRLLLRHATRVLASHGVWRIYCDTPSSNEPMIHLFEREGWTRLPAHERPIAAL